MLSTVVFNPADFGPYTRGWPERFNGFPDHCSVRGFSRKIKKFEFRRGKPGFLWLRFPVAGTLRRLNYAVYRNSGMVAETWLAGATRRRYKIFPVCVAHVILYIRFYLRRLRVNIFSLHNIIYTTRINIMIRHMFSSVLQVWTHRRRSNTHVWTVIFHLVVYNIYLWIISAVAPKAISWRGCRYGYVPATVMDIYI